MLQQSIIQHLDFVYLPVLGFYQVVFKVLEAQLFFHAKTQII